MDGKLMLDLCVDFFLHLYQALSGTPGPVSITFPMSLVSRLVTR